MGAADVMERIFMAGVTLTALDRERLAAEPAERLTDELRNLIRQHKAELIEALTASEAPSPIPDNERKRLTSWLAWIGEDDVAVLAAFWNQVEHDPEARRYFLGFADAIEEGRQP